MEFAGDPLRIRWDAPCGTDRVVHAHSHAYPLQRRAYGAARGVGEQCIGTTITRAKLRLGNKDSFLISRIRDFDFEDSYLSIF